MARKKPKTAAEKLPPHIQQYASQEGETVCLRCRHKFYSKDKIRVRVCSRCSKVNESTYVKPFVDLGPSATGMEYDDH